MVGVSCSCALLCGFAISARILLLWQHNSKCLSVCLSVPCCIPTQHFMWHLSDVIIASVCLSVCLDPDVTRGNGRGCPQVVHYWADLQSLHGFRCYDNVARTCNVSECLYSLCAWFNSSVTMKDVLSSLNGCWKCLWLSLLHFAWVVDDAKKMYCGHARLCVCRSVRGRTPTLLHGPGCNLGAW